MQGGGSAGGGYSWLRTCWVHQRLNKEHEPELIHRSYVRPGRVQLLCSVTRALLQRATGTHKHLLAHATHHSRMACSLPTPSCSCARVGGLQLQNRPTAPRRVLPCNTVQNPRHDSRSPCWLPRSSTYFGFTTPPSASSNGVARYDSAPTRGTLPSSIARLRHAGSLCSLLIV